MNRLSALLPLSISFALTALGAPAQSPTEDALKGLDPVELTAGREVPGQDDLVLERGRYRYHFAGESNRAKFAADPEHYAIQLGGGCGAMGPLSGVGDPDRFAVHDGKIYIFASDGCRTGFSTDPARHIDRPDPSPTGDAAQAARANALLARAVEAVGGAARLDGMNGLLRRRAETQERDGKEVDTGRSLLVEFPDRIRREAWGGDWRRADVVAGELGFVRERSGDQDGTWPHDSAQRLCVEKELRRDPIVVLRARGRDDFVAFATGSGEVAGTPIEQVAVAFDGTTTTLAIEPESGRVLGATYYGRAGSTPLGDVAVTFSDFRPVDGLTLPFTEEVRFDGGKGRTTTWTDVEVDPEVDPALFQIEQSAKPGINERFTSRDLDVAQMTATFEGESREVFVARTGIQKAIGLDKGQAVADIGAGTGLFMKMLASDVGPDGTVYAVDIAPKFVEHLRTRAKDAGLSQVEPVLCEERSVNLPDGSIDVAFVCDTYHHFEYPHSTLATIWRALRPGGRLVVVDFERIPGVSREWILGHVRAGKAQVTSEIEAAGFVLEDEVDVRGLAENYLLRFRRR